MKKPKQRQPEGGVDIFKKPDIPKKPRQPEGSGAPKIKPKKKIVQKQPETFSGKPVVKEDLLNQRQYLVSLLKRK